MNKMISGKQIVKIYGKESETYKALSGIDIEISEGEFVAVMGPSGCGKSTLLFALSGTDSISSGTIEFDGTILSHLNENQLSDIRRTKMGFVFQQPTMLKNLNILDNIILPCVQQNRMNTGNCVLKAKKLMKKTGILGLENRSITEVSGGQLQRAGICRALINDPRMLFADEPTGALNSKDSDKIMDLLSAIHKEGTAILLVTHDTKVAARADRVFFMKDGIICSQLVLKKNADSGLESRIAEIGMKTKNIGL